MDNPNPDSLKAAAREIRARIDENNVLDSLVELFAAQQARLQAIERELGIMRARLQTRDLLLPEARLRYAGKRAINIDAGMPLRDDQGFYDLEYDGTGQPYRWVGPKRTFYFDLHLERTEPLDLTVQFGKHPIATGEGLRCFSDNVEIPLVRTESESFINFTAVLAAREVIGLTRLLFVARKSFSPTQIESWTADSRRLCLLFYRLTVKESSAATRISYIQLAAAGEQPTQPPQSAQHAEPVQPVQPVQAVQPVHPVQVPQPARPAPAQLISAKSRKRLGR